MYISVASLDEYFEIDLSPTMVHNSQTRSQTRLLLKHRKVFLCRQFHGPKPSMSVLFLTACAHSWSYTLLKSSLTSFTFHEVCNKKLLRCQNLELPGGQSYTYQVL